MEAALRVADWPDSLAGHERSELEDDDGVAAGARCSTCPDGRLEPIVSCCTAGGQEHNAGRPTRHIDRRHVHRYSRRRGYIPAPIDAQINTAPRATPKYMAEASNDARVIAAVKRCWLASISFFSSLKIRSRYGASPVDVRSIGLGILSLVWRSATSCALGRSLIALL